LPFVGWFGPRGLASIILALVVIEEPELTGIDEIFRVVTVTVLLSVFAHGLSAHAAHPALRPSSDLEVVGVCTPSPLACVPSCARRPVQ
jgi:NhaP-type Na+/H+ or K+/H+ antiporter